MGDSEKVLETEVETLNHNMPVEYVKQKLKTNISQAFK